MGSLGKEVNHSSAGSEMRHQEEAQGMLVFESAFGVYQELIHITYIIDATCQSCLEVNHKFLQ